MDKLYNFKVLTHAVESWTFFLCALLTVVVSFGAAFVEAGFFVSVVFTVFFAVDLLLSPDGCGFEVGAFLVSVDLSLSFPCLEGVCLELAAVGLTDFLLCLVCLCVQEIANQNILKLI